MIPVKHLAAETSLTLLRPHRLAYVRERWINGIPHKHSAGEFTECVAYIDVDLDILHKLSQPVRRRAFFVCCDSTRTIDGLEQQIRADRFGGRPVAWSTVLPGHQSQPPGGLHFVSEADRQAEAAERDANREYWKQYAEAHNRPLPDEEPLIVAAPPKRTWLRSLLS